MAIARAVLGHVVLNVRDLKKSERFYRDILGMDVSGRNRRTKMCFLSFGTEHHDIALMELPANAKRRTGDGLPGLHHFCVYVGSDQEVDDLYSGRIPGTRENSGDTIQIFSVAKKSENHRV